MIQIEIKTRKNHFYTKKSITCGKTMSVNGGILLTQCQAERKVNLSLQLSVTEQVLSKGELAESLNEYFVSVASDIPPLDISSLPTFLPAAVPPPTVHPHEVCGKLLKRQTNKAMGPDNIP
jgi:hypothetical protein